MSFRVLHHLVASAFIPKADTRKGRGQKQIYAVQIQSDV